jgi:hypothetical protein
MLKYLRSINWKILKELQSTLVKDRSRICK